jgi:peptide/nickel transport system permease protein
MRFTDALLAFPGIILALAFIAIFPPHILNVMVAIGIVQIPRFTRLVRAEVLSLKSREFVQAERALGASTYRILRHAILPNVLAVVSVQIGLTFALSVLVEASLSFLGLGIQPPTPSWGGMLSRARSFTSQNVWYSIASGGAIFATVLSINLAGDAVATATDPRTTITQTT